MELARRRIPVVLISSKTLAELAEIRAARCRDLLTDTAIEEGQSEIALAPYQTVWLSNV